MAESLDELTWHDAIVRTLTESGTAMHYSDIADRIVSAGWRHNVGATPASTVNAVITTNINSEGDRADFIRTGRGEYVLRAATALGAAVPAQELPQDVPDEVVEPTAIEALGMFWRRDLIEWSTNPKLLGQQQRGATVVDFTDQRGVYLLHDGRSTVYVGRITDRALGRRLSEHTTDRLNGRWDRFSWFGVRSVTNEGVLVDRSNLALGSEQVIVELEAVLIESLEPPLNRRRGDGLRAVEYIQAIDPAVIQRQQSALITQMLTKLSQGS